MWLLCHGQGAAGNTAKVLYRSADGGRSWSLRLNCGFRAPTARCGPHIWPGSPAGLTATNHVVLLADEPWWVLASTDGGTTWSVAVDDTSDVAPRVDMVDGTTGFAVGDTGTQSTIGHAAIYATTDGGRTWTRRYTSLHPPP